MAKKAKARANQAKKKKKAPKKSLKRTSRKSAKKIKKSQRKVAKKKKNPKTTTAKNRNLSVHVNINIPDTGTSTAAAPKRRVRRRRTNREILAELLGGDWPGTTPLSDVGYGGPSNSALAADLNNEGVPVSLATILVCGDVGCVRTEMNRVRP